MSGEVQKVFCYLQWIVANLRTYNPLCRKKMAVVYFITDNTFNNNPGFLFIPESRFGSIWVTYLA